jgi:hypothetical protein
VSYADRLARLAARVAEARRPKRLGAATRLARQPNACEPGEQELQSAPATGTPVLQWSGDQAPASSLPLSDEASRWLTRGEVPADLVPLLGDPTLPAEPPVPADPSPAEGASSGPVLARIIEGSPTSHSVPRGAGAQAAPESPTRRPGGLSSIEELPGAHRDGPPMLRLARSPAQTPPPDRVLGTDPAPALATAGSAIPVQELARRSGGTLSEDGTGQSTLTFQPPTSTTAEQPAETPDAGLPSQTPLAPALREQLGDIDIDELYESFLQRLRRDLIHDRERLGDLLGPLR